MSKKIETPKNAAPKTDPKADAKKPESGQENPENAKFAQDADNLVKGMEDLLGRVSEQGDKSDGKDATLDEWLEDFAGDADGEEMTLEEAKEEYNTLSKQVQTVQKQTAQLVLDNADLKTKITDMENSVASDKAAKMGTLLDAVTAISAEIAKVTQESDEKDNTDDRLNNVTTGLQMVDKQLSDIFGKYALKTADVKTAPENAQTAAINVKIEDFSNTDDIDKVFDALDDLEEVSVTLLSAKNQEMREKQNLVGQLQRTERDADKQKQTAIRKLATELLDVADNLDRAKTSVTDEMRKESKDINKTVQDIDAAASKLQAAFNASGIEKIETKGQKFDPTIHEAITAVPLPDVENGHIADVMQDGYTLNKNLLRAPKVVVCKK